MQFILLDDVAPSSEKVVREKLQSPEGEHIDKKRKIRGDVTQLAILGHTGDNAQTIGNMTASQLARKLEKKYRASDKTKVEDIYLIGCEAGLSNNGQLSLAQSIAIELSKQGFINVKIHAISNPVDVDIKGMRVEVVHHVGILGERNGEKEGKLVAHLHRTAEQEAIVQGISELERTLEQSEDKTSKRKIARNINIEKAKPAYSDRPIVTETDDLLAELNRPQNTFNVDGPLQNKIMAQEEFIQAVERLIRMIPRLDGNPKQKNKLAANLQTLLEEARAAKPEHWPDTVLSRIDHYESSKKGVKFLQNSTFYNHLIQFEKDFSLRERASKQAFIPLTASLSSAQHTADVRSSSAAADEALSSREERAPLVRKNITKNVKEYYQYADTNRFHLFKARYKKEEYSAFKGDQLKAKILEKIKGEINDITTNSALTDYINALEKSNEYKILSTGQGFTTRLFHLPTTSKKAVLEMVKDARRNMEDSSLDL